MRKIAVIAFAFAVRGMSVQPLFAQQVSPLYQQTNTEHFALAAGGTIRINDSFGELDIEGWNQPDVEVTVIKTLPYDSKESKSSKDLNAVKVATERKSDQEVVISTTVASHGGWLSSIAKTKTKTDVWVEYHIRAPRDSKLMVRHDRGTVQVNNMAAAIDADSGGGDMIVILPDPGTRSVDARTKIGSVVSDFGETHHMHFVGESLVTANGALSPVVRLRMGRGGITVKTLPVEGYTAEK
jgi:hypothetical protein